MKPAPVLILGIGNVLLSDEGVGPRAVELLAARALGPDVDVLDGGTSGADLVDDIADREKLIVIDAADAGLAPGTVVRLQPEDLLAEGSPMSLHEFGLLDTLAMARHLSCQPRRIVIFGVQPASTQPGLELSAPLRNMLPRLLEMVLEEAGK